MAQKRIHEILCIIKTKCYKIFELFISIIIIYSTWNCNFFLVHYFTKYKY